jgi:glycosyltransferase involved in cell wall biosynthesis
MRLVIYSHHFAPSVGGVESSVETLATGLATREVATASEKVEVVVVTQTARGTFDDRTLPFHIVRKPALFHLARLIRDSDIVHIAGPAMLPLVLSTILRKSAVVEHHGYQAICPNGALWQQPKAEVCPGHFQVGHFRACIQCCQAETSLSRSVRALFLTGLRGWLCRRVNNVAISRHVRERHALPQTRVIYYGIKDPLKGDVVVRDGSGLSTRICFAYVGRFVPEKGVAVLLDAARVLRDEGLAFDILLVGDGPQRGELEKQIRRNGLEDCTRLTGFLRGIELHSVFEFVHVVVMPSVVEETAGLAAIEQMMRGRLVIASSIGGLAEIVGQAGLLFPPRDVAALAACMKRVIADPNLVIHLGVTARKRALELFGHERTLDEHEQLYRRLSNERP